MTAPNQKIADDFLFDPISRISLETPLPSIPKAAGRFQKLGKNAQHPLTVDMRKMKSDLGFTTKMLVNELAEYEKKFLSTDDKSLEDTRDLAPINSVLMSSYLQGWVLQDSFMKSVHSRITNFYNYKTKYSGNSQDAYFDQDIRALFDKWFEELGIADSSNKSNGAPMRIFSKMIAPYYKRSVTAKLDGTFILGQPYSEIEQFYFIVDKNEDIHRFVLNRAEKILFKSNDPIKRSDIIQYAVLYPLVEKLDGKLYFDTTSPSADHTAFFRWYSANKMPRSIQSVKLVEEAVEQAKAANKSN